MALSRADFAAIRMYGRVLVNVLQERDPATRLHCDRVVELCGALGRACALGVGDLRCLWLVAALHDVGKIGIPDAVLLKPARLTADERKQIETHAERGQRIVLAIGVAGADKVALCVRHHHENFDGSGYPDRLRGEDIGHIARILAIVDAYDAMSAMRPYQQRRSHDDIMNTLNDESGRRFDPYLVRRFAAIVGGNGWKAPLH
jgi:HD-GYP domain-containing protein (c-di-GMP phosphodiesterase class II)